MGRVAEDALAAKRKIALTDIGARGLRYEDAATISVPATTGATGTLDLSTLGGDPDDASSVGTFTVKTAATGVTSTISGKTLTWTRTAALTVRGLQTAVITATHGSKTVDFNVPYALQATGDADCDLEAIVKQPANITLRGGYIQNIAPLRTELVTGYDATKHRMSFTSSDTSILTPSDDQGTRYPEGTPWKTGTVTITMTVTCIGAGERGSITKTYNITVVDQLPTQRPVITGLDAATLAETVGNSTTRNALSYVTNPANGRFEFEFSSGAVAIGTVTPASRAVGTSPANFTIAGVASGTMPFTFRARCDRGYTQWIEKTVQVPVTAQPVTPTPPTGLEVSPPPASGYPQAGEPPFRNIGDILTIYLSNIFQEGGGRAPNFDGTRANITTGDSYVRMDDPGETITLTLVRQAPSTGATVLIDVWVPQQETGAEVQRLRSA